MSEQANRVRVVALDDPGLAPFRGLRARGGARRDADGDRFIAESEHVVRRLLTSGWPVESVVGLRDRVERLLPMMSPETVAYALAREALDELLGFRLRRGVLACARRPARASLDALDWARLARQPRALVVAAQGLADPANLGSILRSARAFSIDHVLVDRQGADPLERRAIRGSMGHCFAQPWTRPASLRGELDAAQRAGFELLVATAEARGGKLPAPLVGYTPPARAVLIVGNEGHGVDPALAAMADRALMIPMAPAVDSLGVAVATALLMYALRRPVHERG